MPKTSARGSNRASNPVALQPETEESGLALGASALHESFTTRGEAPSQTALAATLTTTAGFEVPLPDAMTFQVDAHANVHAFKQSNGAPAAAWATPVTFGTRAGIVVRFW